MIISRKSKLSCLLGAAALVFTCAVAIPGDSDPGPVSRNAARGALAGVVSDGVTGVSALKGAAIGAATGAVVSPLKKDRRKRNRRRR